MTETSIEMRVRETVAEQLGLAEEEIQLETTLTGDLGADALDRIELIMAFEEAFDLEIDDQEADGLQTVQDVVDLITMRAQ